MKKPLVKNIYFPLCAGLVLLIFNPAIANESRENKQARLDSACEVVREKKLVPVRKQLVEECVANKELPSRKECVTFYADYGGRMGGRAPLFYDLPECVTAFEFNQSSRSSD
jgi:hypothetical protein